ncbi:MAG: hypothetical protein HY067_09595 [Betaproteobacteria bacterium]|nr:hypothetical protein [Betaproteobacteria bacterium]
MSFDPHCTYAEAQAADIVYIAKPGVSITDPRRPLAQWQAARKVSEIEKRVEQGDSFALFWAIRFCSFHGIVLPPWLAQKYVECFDKIVNHEAKSWDEAFGRPFRKGLQIQKLKLGEKWRLLVWTTVIRERNNNSKLAIGPKLFEKVAKELKLGAPTVKKYYYETEKLLKP